MAARSKILFDAIGYLSRIDPTQGYAVEILTGGIMNVTVRATKTGKGENVGEGRFPNQPSLILKYAPPFVAGVGEKLPMATFRQVIEARALSLFSYEGKGSLSHVCSESSVTVPKLLLHDFDSHVLVMSDLGVLPNLASLFSGLGGYNDKPFPEDLRHSEKLGPFSELYLQKHTSHYDALGTTLGKFFAKLHSPKNLLAILQHPERGNNFLKNPFLSNFAFETGIKPIKRNLELFPQFLSKEEAATLYERAARDNTIPLQDEERSFILADCWPGSILVDPLIQSASAEYPSHPKIAVVDWEFATIGRGLNNDLAQLLARFALLHCAAVCRGDELRQRELSTLAFAITTSYRKTSEQENAPWMRNTGEQSATDGGIEGKDNDRFVSLDKTSLRVKMLRSAFLTHAIEMMRCAFGKAWNCQKDACMIEGKHTIAKHECVMVQAMVKRALWYFRHATDDVHDFCSAENYIALRQGHLEGQWLLNLF